MKKIIFHNNFHNGDIHVSRNFIRDIIKKSPNYEYYYYHTNSNRLLNDLVKINFIKGKYKNDNDEPLIQNINDDILINTWYNADKENFRQYGGTTLRTLYENFKKVYKHLDIQIEDMSFYIPSIDFNYYEIQHINEFMVENKNKNKIFISNGNTLSGQAKNYNMDNMIKLLSTKHTDILFLVSNKTSINSSNVIQTSDIIKLNDNDLCENGFITTFCDIIVGRNSGAQTYSLLKDNIITDKSQIHINNSNTDLRFGLGNLWNNNKKVINTLDYNNIINIVDREITSVKN